MMIKSRIFLLLIGVYGVILETDSYTYPPGVPGYSSPDTSYGFFPYGQPSYPSYSPSSYGRPQSPYYSSCANAKVIEVLDEIFCQHARKKRYSSTIHPTISTIVSQLQWARQLIIIQDAWDAVGDCILVLETFQDEVNSNYADSNLLRGYSEFFQSSTAGASSTSSTTEDAKTNAQAKLNTGKERLATMENQATMFKQDQGINFETRRSQQSIQQKQEAATKEANANVQEDAAVQEDVDEVSKRSVDNIGFIVNAQEQIKRINRTLYSTPRVRRSAFSGGGRKTRGTDSSDYTCALLQPTYCPENKYDELLYNSLDRVFDAFFYLYEALFITYDFMNQIDCGESQFDEQALEEAAISFGTLLSSYYTLLDISDEFWRMYTIVELDYGDDSSSYRAGGSDDVYTSPAQQSDYSVPITPYQPSIMPSYPYSGYTSQPPVPAQSPAVSYSLPTRYQRGSFPVLPQAFFMD